MWQECRNRGWSLEDKSPTSRVCKGLGTSKTLFMQKREWEALRDASGPTEVLDWRCADHAAGTQTTLHLHWTANGIDGTRREYACTPEDNPGELLREDPL